MIGFFAKHIAGCIADPAFAAKAGVLCNVVKDVGAYGSKSYTTYYNKDLEENKRKKIATIDGTSGVINVILQLGIGTFIANKTEGWWMKLTQHASENIKNHTGGKQTFGALVSIAAAMIIGEKIIVPLIGAPAGAWIYDKFIKNKNALPEKIKTSDKFEKQPKNQEISGKENTKHSQFAISAEKIH